MFYVKVKICGKFIGKVSFRSSEFLMPKNQTFLPSFYFVHDLCSSIKRDWGGETMWASFEY